MIKVSFAAPVLTVPSTSACDGVSIIAIITLIVNVIVAAIGAAVALRDLAQGTVELENQSDREQLVEVLVELIHVTEGVRNSGIFETQNNGFASIPAGTRVKLKLPKMESDITGDHYMRVTVDDSSIESDTFFLNA